MNSKVTVGHAFELQVLGLWILGLLAWNYFFSASCIPF